MQSELLKGKHNIITLNLFLLQMRENLKKGEARFFIKLHTVSILWPFDALVE